MRWLWMMLPPAGIEQETILLKHPLHVEANVVNGFLAAPEGYGGVLTPPDNPRPQEPSITDERSLIITNPAMIILND